MNGRLPEAPIWTPRCWLLCIALALTVQLGFIFRLSVQDAGVVVRPPAETRLRLVRTAARTSPVLEAPEKDDPTLFALVNDRGFSRSAWLTIPAFDHQIPDGPQPLHWLSLPADDLADAFEEFVQTNLPYEDAVSAAPTPALANPDLPTPVVVAETLLRVEIGPAGRGLLPGPALPRQPQPILTNSVVRVLVDPAGLTLSAALLSSCLVPQADQDALKFAKAARFAPSRPSGQGQSGFAFGTLVFEWAGVQWTAPAPRAAIAAKR
jgi:TonB family protein